MRVRLDDRHKRHIAVRRDRDRADILGAQHLGDQNGGRAVRCADDANGRRINDIKPDRRRHDDGQEDARLRRRAEQEQLGIGEQRAEVDHRADADEQQQRERLARLDADLKQPLDDAVGLAHALRDLVDDAGHRQVDQDRAEAHRQQQRRLVLLLDRQPDQQPADKVHHHLLPGDGQQAFV